MKDAQASLYRINTGISLSTTNVLKPTETAALKAWPAIGNPTVGFNAISLDEASHPNSNVSALLVIAWAFVYKISNKSPAKNPPNSLERGINTIAHVALYDDISAVYVDLNSINQPYAMLIRATGVSRHYIRVDVDEQFMKQLLEIV